MYNQLILSNFGKIQWFSFEMDLRLGSNEKKQKFGLVTGEQAIMRRSRCVATDRTHVKKIPAQLSMIIWHIFIGCYYCLLNTS